MEDLKAYMFKTSVMYFMASMIPKLRVKSYDEIKQIMHEVSEVSGELPLHMMISPQEQKRLSFPSWEDGKQLTNAQTVALMVSSLWVAVGENPEMCSSMYDTWPIKEAVLIAGGDKEVMKPSLDFIQQNPALLKKLDGLVEKKNERIQN